MASRSASALGLLTALFVVACTADRDQGSATTAAPEGAVTRSVETPVPEPTLEILPPVPIDHCDDVPAAAPAPVVDGEAELPDPVFLAVVNAYVVEHSEVFGGRWLTGDGTFVIAFTDEPRFHRTALALRRPTPADFFGYWPPPQITDRRPIGEWDVAWDVVRVEHTEIELIRSISDVRRAVDAEELDTDTIRVDVARSRLAVDLSDPSDAAVELLGRVVDLGRVCVD